MICCDCGEIILESERRVLRNCATCTGPLHPECAMLGFEAVDNCEGCFNLERERDENGLKRLGSELGEPAWIEDLDAELKARGLRLADLAKKLNVPRWRFHKFMTGVIPPPDDLQARIEVALGLPVGTFTSRRSAHA